MGICPILCVFRQNRKKKKIDYWSRSITLETSRSSGPPSDARSPRDKFCKTTYVYHGMQAMAYQKLIVHSTFSSKYSCAQNSPDSLISILSSQRPKIIHSHIHNIEVNAHKQNKKTSQIMTTSDQKFIYREYDYSRNRDLHATLELINRRQPCPLTRLWKYYTRQGKTATRSRSGSEASSSSKLSRSGTFWAGFFIWSSFRCHLVFKNSINNW